MRINLPIHSYRPQSPARLVNCFAEASPEQSKGPSLLLRAPGISTWTTIGAGPIRGMHYMGGNLYVVSGDSCYKVDQSGVGTLMGSVPGSDVVSMADNGTQLVIVSETLGYVVTSSTFAQITDPDFLPATSVAFIDSYVVFSRQDSGEFFWSALLDAEDYDALDFATAEGAPDNLLGLIVDHRQVFLAGEKSVELWYNAGTDAVFERAPSGFLEIGCAAGKSLAKTDNSVFWLADDLTVRSLRGLTPVRVSQHGVEQAFRQYARDSLVRDAFAFTYTQAGHLFYVLTFPTAGATWVYDVTTNEWHERESYGLGRWRVNACEEAFGKLMVGDYQSNRIGYLNLAAYDEWGGVQRMAWTYDSIYGERRYAFHNRLEIAAKTGVGLVDGQGQLPKVMLEVSDDGGRTFSFHTEEDLGRMGEYQDRVVWHRLGMSADRVYRASVSDPVPVLVQDTVAEVEGGRL